jgi:hypothetical protein
MVQTSCESLPGGSEEAAAAGSLPDSWNMPSGSGSGCPSQTGQPGGPPCLEIYLNDSVNSEEHLKIKIKTRCNTNIQAWTYPFMLTKNPI